MYFDPQESKELADAGVRYSDVWISHTDGKTVSVSVVPMNSLRAFRREMYRKNRWPINGTPAVTLPDDTKEEEEMP